MPKKRKGKSHSIRPVSSRPPGWCKYRPEEVEALVINLAKEGHPPSEIGVILRDKHGIPLTKPITGKSVTEILREADLEPSLPEDFQNLLRKASRLRVHLEKNPEDVHNKEALQNVESKIYKLMKYYKREGLLPPDWKYEAKAVSFF
ncbi:30S ribosomal protein S15 [Candidatus Bathyarchaeota archaeon]|nr:30S ribosomal protein S15 [Candidatus Bathyarchaeota archaeon]NIU81293.1 30S ribosomal protein S15 [Candidatus Bathyarchaeota archaeon]NIV67928.1 30S ribosomal protein S15 [Candidatus Bathyarchaeota archaeon]NIW16369.1 30S ribosomal protein S15 [Candidatus Bathyarchaeota archaeon]